MRNRLADTERSFIQRESTLKDTKDSLVVERTILTEEKKQLCEKVDQLQAKVRQGSEDLARSTKEVA